MDIKAMFDDQNSLSAGCIEIVRDPELEREAATMRKLAALEIKKPRRQLETINVRRLHGLPVPPRRWHVPGLVPARNVTLLGGDGGTGKSLLALQLGVSTALTAPWLGVAVTGGRALYLSAEDELDELHRRLADIATFHRCELSDLGKLKLAPLAGEDAILAAPAGRTNIIEATPLWHDLVTITEDFQPSLVVLDTLADLFAGEENQRSQARQFISLLRGVALKQDTTFVVLAHPSLSGMSSGSGTSGSTGWNNSVRSRLYFQRVMIDSGKVEADPDLRRLETMKANYGRKGESITVRWLNGVFVREQGTSAGPLGALGAILEAEQIFLELLGRYQIQGRNVGATPGTNYAPTIFAKDPLAKGLSRQALALAMNNLFASKKITVVEFGPPSRGAKRIELASEATQ